MIFFQLLKNNDLFSLLFVSLAFSTCLYSSWGCSRQNTTGGVYYSYPVKSTAAVPTNLSRDESSTVLPLLLFVWVTPTFDFTKKKINVILGLWKSKILLNFWSCGRWVCYSSWVSKAIFAYSESSWSTLCLLQSLKRLCDLPGDSECDPCSCSCEGLADEFSQFPCLQKALLVWAKYGTPRLYIIRMRSRGNELSVCKRQKKSPFWQHVEVWGKAWGLWGKEKEGDEKIC